MRTETQIRELLEVMRAHDSDPITTEVMALLDAKNARIQDLLENNSDVLKRARIAEAALERADANIRRARHAWELLSRL